ncbi:TRAP transporter small permease [Salipiger sp. P9]|uniref:TRAP transporter small permease subunit n=1 Tax=Salipiger pentaromativorans TaxID=2943193 RepID=UPI0021580A1C|nr:TRAP transporter small permease [Salipiger pentaromativorans]MCR8547820.1 TRAP transporter small permease [Salipiger pentaromativorans]
MTKPNPLEKLSDAMLTAAAVPVLAMLAHTTADVGMKYLFNQPIAGTLEIVSYYYMVGIVLMPLAAVELARRSIDVDLFYAMLPRPLQFGVMVFVLLLSASAYGLLAAISWPDALRAMERREMVMGAINVTIWPARFLLPLAMSVSALVCLMLCVRLLTDREAAARLLASGSADFEDGVE